MVNIAGDLKQNATGLAHLRHVLDRLSTEDLDRSLGGNWTVKTALGHLAFWDRRQAATLANAGDGERMRVEVVEAAAAIDELLEATDAELLEPVVAGGHAYLVERWVHHE